MQTTAPSLPRSILSSGSLPRSRVLRLAIGDLPRWTHLLGWTILVALGLAVIPAVALFGVMPQDEGELLTYPWLMAAGRVPYRDFYLTYPPGTFVLIAAAMKLGVPGLVAERGLSIGARLLYVLLVNRALTRSWLRFSWLGVPLTFALLFFSPDADIRAYPWIVGAPVLLCALLASRERPRLAAGLFLLASLFRFEFGVAGCVALGARGVLGGTDGRRREFFGAAVALLAGEIAVFGAIDLLAGGMALHEMLWDPIVAIAPGRRLPLIPPDYSPVGVPLAALSLAGPLIAAVAGIALRRPALAATNLAVAVLSTHFLQRPDWLNLRAVSAISIGWLLLTLVWLLEETETGRAPARTGIARATLGAIGLGVGSLYSFLLLAFVVLVAPLSLSSAHARIVPAGARSIVGWTAAEARSDAAVGRYIRSHGGGRVFIAPTDTRHPVANMTALYYVLGLPAASRYLEMDPGIETEPAVQRQIIAELRRCPWVILWRSAAWNEPNASRTAGSALLQRDLRARYVTVLRTPLYLLLRSRVS